VIGGEAAGAANGRSAASLDVSHTYDGDLALKIVGDFNGDGDIDLASLTRRQGYLLPYIEQDNIYKAQAGDAPQGGCAMLIADITDGTSNTMMLRGAPGNGGAGSRSLVDIWEHAFSQQTGANANGIIAILIGLAADPSDPSGEAALGRHRQPNDRRAADFDNDGDVDGADFLAIATGNTLPGNNFCLCDGSVRYIRVDTAAMSDSPRAAQQDAVTASLLASDEYFARFHIFG
jgi:hypothetical protein